MTKKDGISNRITKKYDKFVRNICNYRMYNDIPASIHFSIQIFMLHFAIAFSSIVLITTKSFERNSF